MGNFADKVVASPYNRKNKTYLQNNKLHVERLGRGVAWLDTGTPEAMIDAAQFISSVEQRQGLKIACIEEVAYRMKRITLEQLTELGYKLNASSYGQYILEIAKEEEHFKGQKP